MNPGIHRGLFRERFMISTRISPIALAVSSAIILTACGGGGGGGSSSTTASPTSVTVTPSLGKFTTACDVVLLKSSGESIGTSKINSNGAATIALSGYTGAVIAQVRGGSGCQYYDESTGALTDFGTGKKLSAIVDTTRNEVGVNVLTNLAAARLLDGDKLAAGKTTSDIQTENLSVQRMFQVSDMFAAPTPIGSASDKLAGTSEADKLALKLAALAEIAAHRSTDIASLATSLASDLAADGRLDTLDADTLQRGLTAAITQIAAPSTHLAFTELATGTTLVTNIDDVKGDVTKILAAGSGIEQARKLFADLRTNFLSLSNEAGTGTLDSEQALLKADYRFSVNAGQTIENLSLMTEATVEFFGGGSSTSVGNNWNSYCTKDSATTAHCWFYGSAPFSDYKVELVSTGFAASTWTIDEAYNYDTQSLFVPTGITGSITPNPNTKTVNIAGKFATMAQDTAYTAVDVAFTHDPTTGSRKWAGTGSLDAIQPSGASAIKVAITELAMDEAAKTAKLHLVLTGPHHVFDGTLDLNGLVSASDGTHAQPKNGTLTGSFSNTASGGFQLFKGTLTASQDWTGYDPKQAETDNNYPKATVAFTGTLYKAANSPGFDISLSGNNNAGRKSQAVNFKFTSGNVIVRGDGKQSKAVTGDTWDWTMSNENGVKANYSNANKSGKVLKADGTELGTISTQRVTFIDGTFESLL